MVSYEIEIDKIETTLWDFVKCGGTEADWQKKRDAAFEEASQAGRPTLMLHRIEPRRFEMTLTKAEARGFAIGARIRVSAEVIEG